MSNEMVPGNPGGGALAPVSSSKGIVAPTQGMMGSGGGGFSETWAINKDKHVFVNKKTNEERQNIFIIVEEMHPTRALFPKSGPQKGDRACWSDDGISSYQGIACASCPRVSEVNEFNKYYEANQGVQRPGFIGDCSLRYAIYWNKEFLLNADGSLTLQVHEQRVLLNVPKSSIYAIWGRGAYKAKLDQQQLDIKAVVTKVYLKQRENTDLKTMYDYADFESMGPIDAVMAKVTKTVAVAADTAAAPAQGGFSGGGQALPTMAGQPSGFPPAATTGFPAATAGFGTPTPAAAPGFGAPTAAPAAAPGFPAPTAGFGTPPAAAPGFPAAAAAAPAPQAAPAPAAAAPAGPSFQDMARTKLLADFAALPDNVKPVVLNVLGVTDINAITNDKVIQASQAVAGARGFSAPAAVGAGNPF